MREFLLTRPASSLSLADRTELDGALEAARSAGFLELKCSAWEALCHFTDHCGLMAHGTSDADIQEFVPRQANDVFEFGAQKAVYAASDGLWAMFYAILDRSQGMGMHNVCFSFVDEGEPLYFFSVTKRAFSPGYVYLLPRATFVQDPEGELGGRKIRVAQWASLEPVRPVAKVRVQPEDFPFLHAIRLHDGAELAERIAVNPGGFPWVGH